VAMDIPQTRGKFRCCVKQTVNVSDECVQRKFYKDMDERNG